MPRKPGEHGTISPRKPRPLDLPATHSDLTTKGKDLGVVRGGRSAQDLIGAGRRLVGHLPERLLPQETSSRHRTVIWFVERALVRSGGAGRRSMSIVGSHAIQPWRCHQPIVLRAMGSSRVVVLVSVSSAWAAAGSVSGSGSAGSSVTVMGAGGDFVLRWSGPVGARSPANIHPHVVSEIRWIRAEDFAMPVPVR
ncbi:hypothetical protein [Streptomyces rhizosphaericus]|uniref:Uncharacterized protein n=1 Tax=Streptomyces rhizosphaericus TaxID=114699 RepID=A0ABP3ZSN9_9ACTN|nr:hypothetical protein [Streptomyces cangkringensis]